MGRTARARGLTEFFVERFNIIFAYRLRARAHIKLIAWPGWCSNLRPMIGCLGNVEGVLSLNSVADKTVANKTG